MTKLKAIWWIVSYQHGRREGPITTSKGFPKRELQATAKHMNSNPEGRRYVVERAE